MQPRWPDPGFASPSDLATCRALVRDGSRTFFAAAKLLPREIREPAFALYAFCRVADDAIDLDGGNDALARLRERLDRAYTGRPLGLPADRAFTDMVARFAIPRVLPDALLDGFEWDAAGRHYADLCELKAYAARVAGSVGAMMAMLMGVRSPDVLARACDLGVAMQLTNIARDVGEDARAGRLYLPLQWLHEVGIDPEAWLARPVFSENLSLVIQRLLQAAEVLYKRADAGIAQLPLVCRPGIYAARYIYAEIGCELERIGLDSVSRRAVVPSARKARLLAHSLVAAPRLSQRELAAPLAEVRFLVEAAAAMPSSLVESTGSLGRGAPRWSPQKQVLWLLDLFERLEREQAGHAPGKRQAMHVVLDYEG